MNIEKLSRLAVIVCILLTCAFTARGAIISWGTATDTSGKSDLIEGNGTVITALSGGNDSPTGTNGGASGTTTYNFTGVSFTSPGSGNSFTPTGDDSGDSPQDRRTDNVYDPSSISTTGDTNFDAVIDSMTDANGTPTGIVTGTFTLGNLTDGKEYLIQVFYNDQRDAYDDRTMRYGDGNGNTVDVAGGDSASGVQTNHYGQYATGSFTASGTSQDLTMEALGFGNVHFNAIVITEEVPEPSTIALLALGAVGLLRRRRRA